MTEPERCPAYSKDGYQCEDTKGHDGKHWAWLIPRYWARDWSSSPENKVNSNIEDGDAK